MWGSTQPGTIAVDPPNVPLVLPQLARIDYGRPDSWDFFWSFQVLSTGDGNPLLPSRIVCLFELALGLARAAITIPAFVRVELLGGSNLQGALRFGASTEAAAENAQRTAPNLIEYVTGESLQVRATVLTSDPIRTTTMSFAASWFFAPKAHVRPDWWKVDNPQAQFLGGEDGGT